MNSDQDLHTVTGCTLLDLIEANQAAVLHLLPPQPAGPAVCHHGSRTFQSSGKPAGHDARAENQCSTPGPSLLCGSDGLGHAQGAETANDHRPAPPG